MAKKRYLSKAKRAQLVEATLSPPDRYAVRCCGFDFEKMMLTLGYVLHA